MTDPQPQMHMDEHGNLYTWVENKPDNQNSFYTGIELPASGETATLMERQPDGTITQTKITPSTVPPQTTPVAQQHKTPFKNNSRLPVTREEALAIKKFTDALVDGMLYVKCGECHKFAQGSQARHKDVPHPTEARTTLRIYVCEDC